MVVESGYQTKTVNYARAQGYMAHRNYFRAGAEVGWPDVEIFMPLGRCLLLEFKVPGAEPTKIQSYRIMRLRAMGFTVVVCDSFEDAKKVIDEHSR